MNLLDSLLDAIVRLDGDALVMHVGEKPYVVTVSSAMNALRGPLAWGQVELSSRVLTSEAVLGMLGQILPLDQRHALEEYGAVEHEIDAYGSDQRFTVIAARGGDDVWLELRRHPPKPAAADVEAPTPPLEQPAAIAADAPVALVGQPAAHVEHPADEASAHEPVTSAAAAPPAEEPEIDEEVELTFDEPLRPAPSSTAAAQGSEVDGSPDAPFEIVHEVHQDAPTDEDVDALLAASAAALLRTAPTSAAQRAAADEQIDGPLAEVFASEPEFPLDRDRGFEPVAHLADAELQPQVERAPEPVTLAHEDEPEPAPAAEPLPVAIESEPVTTRPMPEPEPDPEAIPQADAFAWPAESSTLPQSIAIAPEPEAVRLIEDALAPEPAAIAFDAAPETPALAPEPPAMTSVPLAIAPERTVMEDREPEPENDTRPQPEAIGFEPMIVAEREPELVHDIDAQPVAIHPELIPEHAEPEYPGWHAFDEPQRAPVAAERHPLAPPPQPEPSPAVAETEPQPMATAEAPSAGAAPHAVHVVEREAQPIPAVIDTRGPHPEPTRVMAEAESQPHAAAQEPTPERAVILPLSRRSSRQEPSIPPAPHAPVFSIDELLRVAAARGASTVYIVAQSRPMVRADGEINVLDIGPRTPLAEADIDRLMLDMAPAAAREAWQRGLTADWICDFADVGRVRCLTFRDHRGPGLIFRMIPPQAISADQLGLTPEVQALCAQSDGLVLITGPRASGKSTLMASFVDLINRTRSDHVITIESQIGFVHESRRSFVSQREVRDGESVAVAVRSALREDPDVLFISDLRSAEIASAAVEAAESGRLVIASLPAPSTVAAVDRMLELLPAGRRSQAQASLAASLRGVVAQVLVRRVRGGRVAAREVLLNTAAVASLIQEAKTAQLPLAIESGRRHGMMPLNDALAGFVRDGTVHVTEAYRKAFDKQALLTALRRDGIDTSFAEKLA